jgi:hypothetical protein
MLTARGWFYSLTRNFTRLHAHSVIIAPILQRSDINVKDVGWIQEKQ